jgi:hypothetical protein
MGAPIGNCNACKTKVAKADTKLYREIKKAFGGSVIKGDSNAKIKKVRNSLKKSGLWSFDN